MNSYLNPVTAVETERQKCRWSLNHAFTCSKRKKSKILLKQYRAVQCVRMAPTFLTSMLLLLYGRNMKITTCIFTAVKSSNPTHEVPHFVICSNSFLSKRVNYADK
jgi:hypothetical protein